MDHLFISDVHLGAFDESFNKHLEKQVISLIRYCAEQSVRLHILGDLFDYWMEYPGEVPELGLELLAELQQYNQTIFPATYVLGNHDNWDKGYFSELGFHVVRNFYQLNVNGTQIFLHHGDGLSDPEYHLPRPLFHRILRNAWFTRFYQSVLPPDAGLNLMKTFSAMSRDKTDLEPNRLNQWSRNFLNNSTFDYVISGHDHVARTETFPSGTYINTGAFFKDSLVGYYTNSELKLVKWCRNEGTLTPYKSVNDGSRK
jgi:UDP-2,3-diacylglucosamine pyrophosphatase LpxH